MLSIIGYALTGIDRIEFRLIRGNQMKFNVCVEIPRRFSFVLFYFVGRVFLFQVFSFAHIAHCLWGDALATVVVIRLKFAASQQQQTSKYPFVFRFVVTWRSFFSFFATLFLFLFFYCLPICSRSFYSVFFFCSTLVCVFSVIIFYLSRTLFSRSWKELLFNIFFTPKSSIENRQTDDNDKREKKITWNEFKIEKSTIKEPENK